MRAALAIAWLVGMATGVAHAGNGEGLPGIASREYAAGDGVVLAGVPDMAKLTQLPVATTVVVDLRTASEGIADEATALEALGYEYHSIPVDGAVIDPARVTELGEIASASTGKTLIVHCRSANRAAMLWGAHMLEQGASLDEALQTVGPALTGAANREALLGYAARGSGSAGPE